MSWRSRSVFLLGSVLLGAQAALAAEITLYEGEDFHGRAFTTERRVENFREFGYNDRASSVVVDSGRWEVLASPHLQLSARLHDFQVRDPAFCARFRGWLHRAVELTGGRDPQVREPACICNGEPYCEYQATWR